MRFTLHRIAVSTRRRGAASRPAPRGEQKFGCNSANQNREARRGKTGERRGNVHRKNSEDLCPSRGNLGPAGMCISRKRHRADNSGDEQLLKPVKQARDIKTKSTAK